MISRWLLLVKSASSVKGKAITELKAANKSSVKSLVPLKSILIITRFCKILQQNNIAPNIIPSIENSKLIG